MIDHMQELYGKKLAKSIFLVIVVEGGHQQNFMIKPCYIIA